MAFKQFNGILFIIVGIFFFYLGIKSKGSRKPESNDENYPEDRKRSGFRSILKSTVFGVGDSLATSQKMLENEKKYNKRYYRR